MALNRPLDEETAAAIIKLFVEVVIAPEISNNSRAILAGKKNLRVLETGGMPDPSEAGMMMRTLSGG